MKVRYRHKNSELHNENGRGKFYVNGRLRFMGDPYAAMKMFIAHSENDPNVLKQFEKQLEMREQVRWKKDDEKLREEQRQKAMENPFEEPPKKKPVSKRISRSKVKWQY